MASKKLTDLISGGNLQNGDKIYAVRGTDSRQVTADIATSAQGTKADNSLQGISSSTDEHVVVFDGTSGKQAKQGTLTIAGILDRGSHTGTQAISTITNLQTTLDGKANTAAVTTSTNGLMIASDKIKLDGIAAGAQVNLSVGTTAGTVAAGNDSRIVAAVPNTRTVSAGTGLTGGGALSANRSISLNSTSIASLALADGSAQKASNLSDLGNAGTARTNLGLGSIATRNLTVSTSDPSGGSNGDLWMKI